MREMQTLSALRWLRIAQLILAALELGLFAYVVSVFDNDYYHSTGAAGFMLFNAIWTLLVIEYFKNY